MPCVCRAMDDFHQPQVLRTLTLRLIEKARPYQRQQRALTPQAQLMTLAHHFSPRVPSSSTEASAKKSRSTTSCSIFECSFAISAGPGVSGSGPLRPNLAAMFSIADRFHVLIWVACTPYFFDSSESVISSVRHCPRTNGGQCLTASSETLALNSGAWFFLFIILDHLSHQEIHLNKWSEIPRPPLHSNKSLRTLSARYGINQKAVAKRRKRTSVSDLPTGPKDAKSTMLTPGEEVIIVAFRRRGLLPQEFKREANDPRDRLSRRTPLRASAFDPISVAQQGIENAREGTASSGSPAWHCTRRPGK